MANPELRKYLAERRAERMRANQADANKQKIALPPVPISHTRRNPTDGVLFNHIFTTSGVLKDIVMMLEGMAIPREGVTVVAEFLHGGETTAHAVKAFPGLTHLAVPPLAIRMDTFVRLRYTPPAGASEPVPITAVTVGATFVPNKVGGISDDERAIAATD